MAYDIYLAEFFKLFFVLNSIMLRSNFCHVMRLTRVLFNLAFKFDERNAHLRDLCCSRSSHRYVHQSNGFLRFDWAY